MKPPNTTDTRNAPLGEFIKTRRESHNITKADACRRSGLDYSYWIKLEAGVYQMPNPKVLDRVAEVIECRPADLYALAGYRLDGELPSFGPYLRSQFHLPSEAIQQLESYFSFLRNQYGIADDQPVFPPKPAPTAPTEPERISTPQERSES